MCGWLEKLKKAEFGGHVAWSILKCYHSAPDLQMWTSIPSQPVSILNIIKYIHFLNALLTGLLFSHSVMSDSLQPYEGARQASLSFTISRRLLKFMSIESVMPSNHLILCHPLILLPSIFPCIRVFSNESVLHIRWPKDWSFSFSISPSNEYSGLISFGIDWFDLLTVQGTLKSLLQHHNLKASILWQWWECVRGVLGLEYIVN